MRVYQIFSVSVNVIKLEPENINCVTLKGLHSVVDEDMELSFTVTTSPQWLWTGKNFNNQSLNYIRDASNCTNLSICASQLMQLEEVHVHIYPFSLLHLYTNICGYSLKGKAVWIVGNHKSWFISLNLKCKVTVLQHKPLRLWIKTLRYYNSTPAESLNKHIYKIQNFN